MNVKNVQQQLRTNPYNVVRLVDNGEEGIQWQVTHAYSRTEANKIAKSLMGERATLLCFVAETDNVYLPAVEVFSFTPKEG